MNIFAFLPADSDDENQDQKKDTKPVKTQEKKTGQAAEKKQPENAQNNNQQANNNNQQNRNQRPQTNQRQYQNRGDNNQNYNRDNNNQNYQNRDQQYRPRGGNDGNVEQGQGQGQGPRKEYKPRVQRDRDDRKPKGVPSEPHPQDRQSGTGNPAFLKNDYRKGGAGKGNYGTIKDELVGREELKEAPQQQQQQEQQPEQVQEPEVVDNTMTLAEYYSKLGITNETQQVQVQQQKQLNEEDLKKEKLQLVHSRNEKQLDTQITKASTKGKKGPTTYQVGCNSEHSNLLGVKSGTTLVQYTVKKEGEQIVGEVKREPKKDNNTREQRNPQTKQPHQNRKPKVNVENEDDFPKLA